VKNNAISDENVRREWREFLNQMQKRGKASDSGGVVMMITMMITTTVMV
jgi:hypothetical protein